jgi:DNA-binding transcriptional MerR regulator
MVGESMLSRGMFKIGEFSKLTRVTVKMLRHYDEIGLLEPSFVESERRR